MSDSNSTSQEDTSNWMWPVLTELWVQRGRILTVVAMAAVIIVLGAVTYLLTRPSERTASVAFQLLFEGAFQNRYPNGTTFSRSDLIAEPVLSEVFKTNDLERYLTYPRFKNALFVFESNPELDMLNFEYNARLSDIRLQGVERARIETEYRQKLEARQVPRLSLRFMLRGDAESPPSQLMEKVLSDVLGEWAKQTALQRGALGYQVDVLTPNVILKDTLNTQTMLIRYDLLRRHVQRVLDQVDRLEALPGASAVRLGVDKLSLIDLKTTLDDLLQFQLNPLIQRRLIYALAPNEVSLNMLYLDDRILELKRVQSTARQRKQQREEALRAFTADAKRDTAGLKAPEGQAGAGPQLSDSFLGSLFDIAGRSGGMEYRTKLTDDILAAGEEGLAVEADITFYEETLRLLRSTRAGSRPVALKPEDVATAFEGIQTRVVEVLTLTNLAYTTMSEANLNPRGALYRLSGPFAVKVLRTVTIRSLAMSSLMIFIIVAMVTAMVVVGQAMYRRSDFARLKRA